MIWLTWRQFRAQAMTAVAVLAAAAIYFLVTGLHMHHTYTADLASCAAQQDCGGVQNRFQQDWNAAFQLAELLVIATPALIGIFWGAPLIGRELETGTHQLTWNQSVTRTRWLAVKLTGVGIAAVATAGLLSYLLTWWAGPLDHINGNRFAGMAFATRDIAPLGYAAFAFALGTTAGLVLRRTVPAMAVTLAVFIGVQILMPTVIRPHLLASTQVTYPINQTTTSRAHGIYGSNGNFHIEGLGIPAGAWVISAPPVKDSAGRVAEMDTYAACFPDRGPDVDTGRGVRAVKGSAPAVAKGSGNRIQQIGACLAGDNLHESFTYQPAGHYWPLQWFETGIFLALSGALSGFSFWWIRRRQN